MICPDFIVAGFGLGIGFMAAILAFSVVIVLLILLTDCIVKMIYA